MSRVSKPIIPKPLASVSDATPKTEKPKDKLWTFSFRFWKQIEYFGLSHTNKEWLISLLERLQNLSQEKLDDFRVDQGKRDRYRYHGINWSQKNIPIQRTDLNWIPADYLNNETEFPLQQFSISTGLGRIVGFFDETQTFNIVLLDPLHNIQPAKDYAYKVAKCQPATGCYELLYNQLQNIKKNMQQSCHVDNKQNCILHEQLEKTPTNQGSFGVIVLAADRFNVIEAFIADNGFESIDELILYSAETAQGLKQSQSQDS